MDIIKVKCPHCSSFDVINLQANHYVCKYCEQQFYVQNENEYRVEHIIEKDYCPICGKKTEHTDSYKCAMCKRINICSDDIYHYSERGHNTYICYDCMKKNNLLCSYKLCKKVSELGCIACGKRFCSNHIHLLIKSITKRSFNNNVYFARWWAYYCERCDGFLCPTCLQVKRGIIRNKLKCPVCGDEVHVIRGSSNNANGVHVVRWMKNILNK